MEQIAVIGLGLIGGSMAFDLKERGDFEIIGFDKNEDHVSKALSIGFIDKKGIPEDLKQVSAVIVAVPVDITAKVVGEVLDQINSSAFVFDVGSVKGNICKAINKHPKRKQFVAAHPFAGTEHSGPEAAIRGLFDNKVNIICEADKSDWRQLDKAISLFKLLKMKIKMMDPQAHDRHAAYVSHLSHVSSFILGKTVLDIEKSEETIFDMASTGFASTVRLAKSSGKTWSPIFLENKENIVKATEEYIKNLQMFKEAIVQEDKTKLTAIMNETNHIKAILEGIITNNS
jgi:prephenate dehydrogenase